MARILIDTESSVDILYKDALDPLGLSSVRLLPLQTPLYNFSGSVTIPLGMITLPITVREEPGQVIKMVDLVVIDHPWAYNMILGRPFLFNIKAIVSMYHLTMKFPVEGGIGTIKGNQHAARRCYASLLKEYAQVTT
ncbi:hypothetical protein ACOSP7_024814 [Xanthoceras sorbifolium]